MPLQNYKMDIGAYQTKHPGKDPNKKDKQNIGADPGGGKPIDTIIHSARKGSYTTAEGVSRRQTTV